MRWTNRQELRAVETALKYLRGAQHDISRGLLPYIMEKRLVIVLVTICVASCLAWLRLPVVHHSAWQRREVTPQVGRWVRSGGATAPAVGFHGQLVASPSDTPCLKTMTITTTAVTTAASFPKLHGRNVLGARMISSPPSPLTYRSGDSSYLTMLRSSSQTSIIRSTRISSTQAPILSTPPQAMSTGITLSSQVNTAIRVPNSALAILAAVYFALA